MTLTKDHKNPNSMQDNPNKVCIRGSKARHLLLNHTSSMSHTKFQIWKKVCDVTTYRGNVARLGIKRARVWESYDGMVKLLKKLFLQEDKVEEFKQAIQNFTAAMVDAWEKTHITHYMVRTNYPRVTIGCIILIEFALFCLQHILYAHGPYFVEEYGSLALWRNQGMERSHYQAKAAYFKNTQHSGGKDQSNALHEMFNWFYQALIGNSERKARGNLSLRQQIMKVITEDKDILVPMLAREFGHG